MNAISKPTWEQLVAMDHELASYEEDARQAGHNGAGWWLAWLPTFYAFRSMMRRLNADVPGAEQVVLGRLRSVYKEASHRAASAA